MGGLLDKILETIEKTPDFKAFMTVEELEKSTFRLVEKHSDIAEVFEAGRSRDGRPIYAIRIRGGGKNALLFGCPHPNEPVGTLMLEYLSWRLVEDDELREELGYTWYILKVVDVDGLKLNEGWLKGPYTPLNYARNYYRPPGDKQVEWTFPIEYKTLKFNNPLPETRALMKIISEAKPIFIYSLHNAGFGGVYYYISEEAPILYPTFYYFPRLEEVPLSLGEPEVPWAKQLARAIYHMVSTPEYYDYLEKYSDRDPSEIIRMGTDSYDYARRFNPKVLELVTEVPYYYDPRIEDTSRTSILRRKAVLDNIENSKKHYELIKRVYDEVREHLKLKSRFRETIEYYLEVFPKSIEAEENWAKTAEELEREATVAEVFDNYQVSEFYRLLSLGTLYRMLLVEVDSGNERLKNTLLQVENMLEEKAENIESQLNYKVIPLKSLVKIQLAAGLYTALYAKYSR